MLANYSEMRSMIIKRDIIAPEVADGDFALQLR